MSERARALEQALNRAIDRTIIAHGDEVFIGEGYSGRESLLTYFAQEVAAVATPPSGASPQAETSDDLSELWRQELYPHVEPDTFKRFLCDLTAEGWDDVRKEVFALQSIVDSRPAPVSPVEPTCACGKPAACRGAYDGAPEAFACDDCCGHGGEDGKCSPVEPEPPTTCRCLDCEPLTDPGPKPSEDDINRLEKAAWDSKTDRVLVWYRDRAEMFSQRLRETERAWQLDRKKSTVEPEPCVWRDIATVPKDGTRILLTPAVWTAERVVSAYYRLGMWWIESADARGSIRAFTDPDEDASHWPFTHWTPLPGAPLKVER